MEEHFVVNGEYKCVKCGYKFSCDYVYPNKNEGSRNRPRPYRFCKKCGKVKEGEVKPELI